MSLVPQRGNTLTKGIVAVSDYSRECSRSVGTELQSTAIIKEYLSYHYWFMEI